MEFKLDSGLTPPRPGTKVKLPPLTASEIVNNRIDCTINETKCPKITVTEETAARAAVSFRKNLLDRIAEKYEYTWMLADEGGIPLRDQLRHSLEAPHTVQTEKEIHATGFREDDVVDFNSNQLGTHAGTFITKAALELAVDEAIYYKRLYQEAAKDRWEFAQRLRDYPTDGPSDSIGRSHVTIDPESQANRTDPSPPSDFLGPAPTQAEREATKDPAFRELLQKLKNAGPEDDWTEVVSRKTERKKRPRRQQPGKARSEPTAAGSVISKGTRSVTQSGITQRTEPAKRTSNKPCRNFAAGNCAFGKRCWFSHPAPSVAGPSRKDRRESKKSTSRDGLLERLLIKLISPRSNQPQSVRKSKVPCRAWTETGTCQFGRRCHFTHGKKREEQSRPKKDEASSLFEDSAKST